MDDSAMIAQMAQFSALEATQQLQQTIQQSNNIQTIFQAGALIGKYVQADQPYGSNVTGAVTGVDFTTTNGVVAPTLQVNGKDIDYSEIAKVSSTRITNSSTGTPPTGTPSTGTPPTGTTPTDHNHSVDLRHSRRDYHLRLATRKKKTSPRCAQCSPPFPV